MYVPGAAGASAWISERRHMLPIDEPRAWSLLRPEPKNVLVKVGNSRSVRTVGSPSLGMLYGSNCM